MVVADLKGLDGCKAIRMALLHDLSEALTGDLTPSQKAKKERFELEEREAMKNILSKLPEGVRENYMALWEEYRRGDSPEAVLVHESDKLEMMLQAKRYVDEGYEEENLRRFWKGGVDEKILKELAEKLKIVEE
jgi:putative hydrolase of HD superfamily